MKKVTVKDIARVCNCSVGTVSKALNGTDRVSEATAKKILKTAKAMGYRPGFSAQSLASKTRKIGIVISGSPPEVFGFFETGIERAMSLYGEFGIEHEYIIFGDFDKIDFRALSESFSALIIAPPAMLPETEIALTEVEKKIPVVYLQTIPQNKLRGLCNITVEAECVGRIAAEYLSLCSVSRQVAVISGHKEVWVHDRNIKGFGEFAEKCGLKITAVEESYDSMQTAYEVTEKILRESPETDGIFVSSYVSPAVARCVRDKKANVKIIGVDIFADSAQALKNGDVSALIFQNQKFQAEKAVDAAVSSFRGIPTEEEIKVKPEIVLQSNIDLYWRERK